MRTQRSEPPVRKAAPSRRTKPEAERPKQEAEIVFIPEAEVAPPTRKRKRRSGGAEEGGGGGGGEGGRARGSRGARSGAAGAAREQPRRGGAAMPLPRPPPLP
ncbi:H/ACA ribonucleoprotein complex subunit GAR1-like [Catharus ustulatus]|uniref:H/ACA ribonucleoprotein complex subunit GAR1-like n=1 Tax=Catharus ustulatus TaxID=91951 RepID=UPI001407F87D|nr:H/ACA ribonucleoprotein complex subunit GAR1-like [Catharus ustulatus]